MILRGIFHVCRQCRTEEIITRNSRTQEIRTINPIELER